MDVIMSLSRHQARVRLLALLAAGLGAYLLLRALPALLQGAWQIAALWGLTAAFGLWLWRADGAAARTAAASGSRRGAWASLALVAVAVLLLGAGCAASARPSLLERTVNRLFGPPPVQMRESYAANPGGSSVDHSAFDALLQRHVDSGGMVDYAGLQADAAQLDAYIASLATVPVDSLGRDARLALLINAYNAFTLRLILDHYPVASIRDIPDAERWDHVRWSIGGKAFSLNQIEHEQIRAHFAEPRIHFALVCAAWSCPKLRAEAYVAECLEAQLADQTAWVHARDRWLIWDPDTGRLGLTRLYQWYAGDFDQAAGSVSAYVARYHAGVAAALAAGRSPEIYWLDYDWDLNDQARHGHETATEP